MSLSQIHPVNPGDRIESAIWNAEFQNILSHPIDLISPSTGAINFAGQAHTGLPPTAITATSGVAGQVLSIGSGGTPAWVASQATASRVVGLQGTVSSQGGTFAADSYVMRSTIGTSWVVSATSGFSVSIGTAGPLAGGRDVAGAFSSTDVYWYAISTGQGSTTVAGIVSSQAPPTGPVLPTNYTGWTFLGGSNYTSASTTVQNPHYFRGAAAVYSPHVTFLSGGTSTSVATISLASVVPANALRYTVDGAVTLGYNNAADGNAGVELHATTSGVAGTVDYSYSFPLLGLGVAHNYGSPIASVELPHSTSRAASYNIINVSTAGFISNAAVNLFITKYINPNGDV